MPVRSRVDHNDYASSTRLQKLSDALEAVRAARPDLDLFQAMALAEAKVDRGTGIEDRDRRLLHSLALKYASENHVDYARALVAVGQQYEELAAPAAAAELGRDPRRETAPGPRDRIELDQDARRYMSEHEGTSYHDALLEVGRRYGAEPSTRPSKTRGRAGGTSEPATTHDHAHAHRGGDGSAGYSHTHRHVHAEEQVAGDEHPHAHGHDVAEED